MANISDSRPPGKENPFDKNKDKPKGDMQIVAYNILVLVGYTILSKLSDGGFIFDAFLIFAQVVVCLVLSASQRSWSWLLSGVLVLVIGFSTCTMLASDFK